MSLMFRIDKGLQKPIYEQIVDSICQMIDEGNLQVGDQIPSINQLASEFHLARETVVKSFKILQEKGIIKAVHGKGFFVSATDLDINHRIFVLFDTLSAYKEVLYHSLKRTLGTKGSIDIYFHHFNPMVFEKMIQENVGNYTSYIILPIEHPRLDEILSHIPTDKLYLIDRKPVSFSGDYHGIYQDFSEDIYCSLESVKENAMRYKKLVLVFRNVITTPPDELVDGFNKFCEDYNLQHEVITESIVGRQIERSDAYLVIDDEDLVYLVEEATRRNFKTGHDIGIISYNETPLKKVVAGGISVISTDFEMMGSEIISMISNKEHNCRRNPCRFINRASF